MGFADAYLLRAGLRNELIAHRPHPGLEIIVTIPAYNESGLERCLDSLFQCDTSGIRAEVIVLVNAAADSPPWVIAQNKRTYRETLEWIADHPHPDIAFHVHMDHTFSRKEAGVGMARKILMDEAVRRFSSLERPEGLIASMDADSLVETNYLQALTKLFRQERPDGCAVYFEHPLSGPGFGEEVYRAIMQYELHQRYYLRAVRSTGYPHAFHTVGSCFAVNADVYCREGGMNRRKGGEDFYFIQKVARRGNFRECNTTRVIPSPRPSDRVPFGTGPLVKRLTEDPGKPLLTYDPRPFTMLREFFGEIDVLDPTDSGQLCPDTADSDEQRHHSADAVIQRCDPVLVDFLSGQRFGEALEEIRKNTASPAAFRKRFWRWFHMFRILKFLHYAREHGYPDIPVRDAAAALLRETAPVRSGEDTPAAGPSDLRSLLEIYRCWDRETVGIKRVTIRDIDRLQQIGRQTFSETFSAHNSEENMKKYLDEEFSVAKLTSELNDKNSEFYFATLGNQVLGYLKVNVGPSQTELQDDRALEIERIYVLKEYHGKNVGQLLFDRAIQIARQKNAEYVWLGVWEGNARALRFYRKNGFVAFDTHIFRVGDDEQTDILMKSKPW